MAYVLITKYANVITVLRTSRLALWVCFFQNTFFLKLYYTRTELLWQEGLLVDFLQKKSTERFVRRFLTVTSYLVSERLFFEWAVRFYLDLIIWPLHKLSLFEVNNVGLVLLTMSLLLLVVYLLVTSAYFFFLIF